MYGTAKVCGDAQVYGDALVCGAAQVCGTAKVCGDALVCGGAQVYGTAKVYGAAKVCGDALVCGDAFVYGDAQVSGNALVDKSINYAVIKGFGTCYRPTTFFRCQDKTVKVSCGCFLGTIDEFRNQVKNTRGGKIAKEYLMIADLMELHFSEDGYDD